MEGRLPHTRATEAFDADVERDYVGSVLALPGTDPFKRASEVKGEQGHDVSKSDCGTQAGSAVPQLHELKATRESPCRHSGEWSRRREQCARWLTPSSSKPRTRPLTTTEARSPSPVRTVPTRPPLWLYPGSQVSAHTSPNFPPEAHPTATLAWLGGSGAGHEMGAHTRLPPV